MKFMKKRISSLLIIGALTISQLCIFPFTANAATTIAGHGLGCIPATSAQISAMPKVASPSSAAALPSSVDWTSQYPTPGDQGSQGSCTAWAVAYADKSMQEGLEYGWSLSTSNHQFSPAYVYNQIDGGVDLGSSISAAMQLLMDQGCCTLQTMPYNQYDYTTQPNATQKAEAQNYKEQSYALIGCGGSVTTVTSIEMQLAADNGVVLQIPVYSEFYNGSDGADYYNENGQYEGDHAICLIGYNNNMAMPDGTVGAFKFINSWGTAWGDGGYGYISYNVIEKGQSDFVAYDMIDDHPITMVTAGVTAGYDHAVLLKSDGTIYAWGNNDYGQFGNNTSLSRSTPVSTGLSGMVAVSAGYTSTVALKPDGTVWTWGCNYYGELGSGTVSPDSTIYAHPVQVKGLTGGTAISAGYYHDVALKSDGTLWAWGENNKGQLGNGTTADSSTPVQVKNIANVIAVAAGGDHTVAINSDGTVWAWGYNGSGQLGNGTTADSSTPVQVKNLTGVIAVAAGGDHTAVLKSDGTVWTFGDNSWGQLGNGTTTNSSTPVQVKNLTGVIAISAGWGHTVVLKSDGTVWAFGEDLAGQLGNGANGVAANSVTPVQVNGLTDVIGISVNGLYSIAYESNGTIWTWGYNSSGQLGNGTTTDSSVPVQVPGLNLN